MFTSRQSLTAIITFVVLLVVYQTYDQTFGRFTDYEQLEVGLRAQMPLTTSAGVYREHRESEIAAVRGFGPNCKELNAPLILESRKRIGEGVVSKRGVGLFIYAIDYEINPDGNNPNLLRLHPFSLVQIKAHPDGRVDKDEVLTVQAHEGVLEFDRPVELTKLSGVKPIAGWVQGQVELKSNNRTDDPADDMMIFADRLDYDKSKNLIWARDWIRLDEQDATISGKGMQLELYPETPPGEPEPDRKHDVRRIHLFKQVRFHLVIDENEGFLGPAVVEAPKNAVQPAEGVPTPVTIKASGPFHYDLEKDQASFNRSVQVIRELPAKQGETEPTFDQLECDQLVLQFRPKTELEMHLDVQGAVTGDDENGGESRRLKTGRNLKLQTVTATGTEVILLSDSQHLYATGNYLFHNADTRRVVLRAPHDEMVASHDNTKIHGRSLVIEQGEGNQIREMIVDGPDGWMEIDGQRATGTSERSPMKVRWQGTLRLAQQQNSDVREVTITEHVELDEQHSSLKSDRLVVRLAPDPSAQANQLDEPAAAPGEQPHRRSNQKLRPIWLRATGHVSAHSKDLTTVTDDFEMEIAYVATPIAESQPAIDRVPATPGEQAGTATTISASPETTTAAQSTQRKHATAPARKNKGKDPLADARPRRDSHGDQPDKPLEVNAKRVFVVVERSGSKSRPVRAEAHGNVVVTQAPSKPGDDPVDIRGQRLNFSRHENGDVIRVRGTRQEWAIVKTTEMTLAGTDEVFLDETQNQVNVAGRGYLILMTSNDLTGKKTSGDPRELRIEWAKTMAFNGKAGRFEGDVRAQQAPAEVRCQIMDVYFDRKIIFRDQHDARLRREGNKPQIETVDCDKDVVVFDTVLNADGVPIRKTTLVASVLHYDNLFRTADATADAAREGILQVIERQFPTRDHTGRLIPPEFRFQLTQVAFYGKMRADDDKQTAKFYENVHILHTPIDIIDPEKAIDERDLPPDGLTIDAVDFAQMGVRTAPHGEKYREFRAGGNVRVEASKYWGQCDRLSFDQQKELLVFDSVDGREAHFYKRERPGQRAQEFTAKTVKYWKKTQRVSTDGNRGFQHIEVGPSDTMRLQR